MGGALGNVILGYRALTDPVAALKESNALWLQSHEIAKEISQAGLIYYYASAYAALRARLPGAHGSIPTSAVYFNKTTGGKTYVAWNPRSVASHRHLFRKRQTGWESRGACSAGGLRSKAHELTRRNKR